MRPILVYVLVLDFDASIISYSLAHTVYAMDYGVRKNNMGNKIVPFAILSLVFLIDFIANKEHKQG